MHIIFFKIHCISTCLLVLNDSRVLIFSHSKFLVTTGKTIKIVLFLKLENVKIKCLL